MGNRTSTNHGPLTEDELKTILKTTYVIVSGDLVFLEQYAVKFQKDVMDTLANGGKLVPWTEIFAEDLPDVVDDIQITAQEFARKRKDTWIQIDLLLQKLVNQVGVKKDGEIKQREAIKDILFTIFKDIMNNELTSNREMLMTTLSEEIYARPV